NAQPGIRAGLIVTASSLGAWKLGDGARRVNRHFWSFAFVFFWLAACWYQLARPAPLCRAQIPARMPAGRQASTGERDAETFLHGPGDRGPRPGAPGVPLLLQYR